MPPALCLSPSVLDHSFPQDLSALQRVSRALGNLQEAIAQEKCSLLLTTAMNEYVENFEWQNVTSYPLLLTVYSLLVQWLLQPHSGIRIVFTEKVTNFMLHPVPVGSGEGPLIKLWQEQLGKLYVLHGEVGSGAFCVGIACDHAYSGGLIGNYNELSEEKRFPLVGPNELAGLEEFEKWQIPSDINQMSVRYEDAKKNISVLGGKVDKKAEGSHYKVTFSKADRPWVLDYNVDPIPERFVRQLVLITGFPLEVIKYVLIYGQYPEKKARF